MSYDFSFSTKSIILILVGCLVIGVLLFFAGYIIGIDKGQSGPSLQASLPGHDQLESKKEPEKQPVASPLEKPSASKKAGPPAPAPEKPGVEKGEAVPASAAAEKKSAEASPEAKASSPKEGEEAKDKDDSKGKDTKDKDKPAFSVQLGAFQTEDHALALRDRFKGKGYPVFLFRVLDPNGHVWHTVRMGHYGDMKEASQEAAKITNKEQIAAWVRPANAF